MEINKLQALVVDALEDVKAQEIAVFDTQHLTALFDRLAIASGTSNRQTKALAASVRDKVKQAGGNVISIEGEDTGEWVLVDLGDMIVHIMQPAIRAYYRLEEIWGDKPLKLADVKRLAKADGKAKPARKRAAKAEQDEVEEVVEAAPRRPRKSAATRGDEEAAPAKRASKTASKALAKTASKTAAKTAGKTATKTTAKTASKTSGARKTAAKAPVGKTVKVAAKTTSKTASKTPRRATAGR